MIIKETNVHFYSVRGPWNKFQRFCLLMPSRSKKTSRLATGCKNVCVCVCVRYPIPDSNIRRQHSPIIPSGTGHAGPSVPRPFVAQRQQPQRYNIGCWIKWRHCCFIKICNCRKYIWKYISNLIYIYICMDECFRASIMPYIWFHCSSTVGCCIYNPPPLKTSIQPGYHPCAFMFGPSSNFIEPSTWKAKAGPQPSTSATPPIPTPVVADDFWPVKQLFPWSLPGCDAWTWDLCTQFAPKVSEHSACVRLLFPLSLMGIHI